MAFSKEYKSPWIEQEKTAVAFLSPEDQELRAYYNEQIKVLQSKLKDLYNPKETDEDNFFRETMQDDDGNIIDVEAYIKRLQEKLSQYAFKGRDLSTTAYETYIDAMASDPEFLYSEAERLMGLFTFEHLKNEIDSTALLNSIREKNPEALKIDEYAPPWIFDYKDIKYIQFQTMSAIMLPLRAFWRLYPKQYQRKVFVSKVYFEEPEYIGEGEEPELGIRLRKLYNGKTEEFYKKVQVYEPDLDIFRWRRHNSTAELLEDEQEVIIETIASNPLSPYAPAPSNYVFPYLTKILNAEGLPNKSNITRSEKQYKRYDEKENEIIYTRENRGQVIEIGISDPDTFWKNAKSNNKGRGVKKNFQFVLQKMAQQNYPKDIVIDLKEMVSLKMYSNTDHAFTGLQTMYSQVRRIDIRELFNIVENGTHKKELTGGQLFYHRNRRGDIYTITANDKFPFELFAKQYFLFPLWAYGLDAKSFDIVQYIFFLARQHAQEIANKGKFNISLDQLHNQLQLPLPDECNNQGKQRIRTPILESIAEITKAEAESKENPQTAINGTMGIIIHAPETRNTKEWLTGYIEIKLTGDYITNHKKIAQSKQRQIEAYKAELEKQRARQQAKATLSTEKKKRGRPPKKM